MTRTLVLAAVARRPCSTSDVSRAVGTTLSGAASTPAACALPGLIATRRQGPRVVHTATALGEQMLVHLLR